MTENFIFSFAAGPYFFSNRAGAPPPAPATASLRSAAMVAGTGLNLSPLVDLYAITLDHRIGQQLVRDLRGQRTRLIGGLRLHFDLEELALPHVADAGVAHRVKRVGDGLPLGVEDGRLECDENPCFHFFP